ncbi:MAG: molybdate ABC transporter permease subunit [Cyanobacteria bacterium P01_H01_bin.15]
MDLSPLWISLKTATLSTSLAFTLGLLATAWSLNDRSPTRNLWQDILTTPLVLLPTVAGFGLLWLIGRQGPLGQLLKSLNINIIFNGYAAVLAATVVAFPLAYKTLLASFEQVDPHLLDCARTLGASETTVFWRILLPLSKPGLLAATLLAFARALGEFGAPLMVAGSIPGKTQTIPMAIYFAAERGDLTQALFWVVLMLAIALGVTIGINQNSKPIRRRPNKRIDKPGRATDTPLNSPQIFLQVDITKELPGFTLDAKFTTEGERLGILGASGAGKSTLLRCLAGLETPDHGKIILNGRVLFDSEKNINLSAAERKIGLLFQNYDLFTHLTVQENIAFGLISSQALSKISDYISELELTNHASQFPTELSGGQQQRVALARVLATEPELLLLDEPLTALDSHLHDRIQLVLLKTLQRFPGSSLIVSHSLDEIYRLCLDLLVLEKGVIAPYGQTSEIFQLPPTVGVAQLTGCQNLSRAEHLTENRALAIDWKCELALSQPCSAETFTVGIYAHKIEIVEDLPGIEGLRSPNPELQNSKFSESNVLYCCLTQSQLNQRGIRAHFTIGGPGQGLGELHLQADISQELWQNYQEQAPTWRLRLPSKELLVFG